MIRLLLLACLSSLCAIHNVWGQFLPPALQSEPAAQPASVVPRLRLTYYINHQKEIDIIELKDWSPDKDVIITGKWAQRKVFPVPGARGPDEPRGSSAFAYRRRRVPLRRVWEVIYVDASMPGKSHLHVDAVGLPRFSERILGTSDVISFLHVPLHGWHQLGKAERAYRRFLIDGPEELAAPPTRSR